MGPNTPDNTLGREVLFTRDPNGTPNVPPTAGGLYFGHMAIDGQSKVMTVMHYDVAGTALHKHELIPA